MNPDTSTHMQPDSGSEKLRPDTFMNRPGHGSLEMNKEASQTSALIQNSVSTVPGSQNQLPVPILLPICDTDNSSSGQFEYINAPGYSMSSCRDMTSWALQQSSKQYNAYPRIAQFLVPHSANQLGSVGQYKGQSSALNFHSGTTMTGADNARSGEIRNVTVLSVPRQTHLPNYLIRQTANVTESYSASLPVPRTSNTNQPLNFAVAAALASLGANTSSSVNQQQRAHQPHYFSNELLTNSSNISQIGVNSQRPSNPLLDHFHAVAAMSTVAQHHRLSPVYFPNSINQTNPFNMSPPVPLPMYYATPQLPLQAPLQRNPFQRLQQNALYPMQTYTHQSIHNVGSHEPSEIMKSDSKRGLQVSNLTQHTNNFIYPLLLQPPVHIQQNKSPTTNLNVTGLRIHYSSQSTKGSFNPVEIAPVPITFAVINTNGNISNTDTSVSKGISTSSTYSESKISFPITSATVTDLTGNASFKIENHSSDSGAAVSLAAVSSAENPGCTITSDNHADKTLKPIDKATSPGSVHDSEDSVSSGIGDMTATSTGDNDSRNNSSCTLTEVTHNPNCGYLRNKCLTQVKEKTTGT
ncbi:unnamed protein product [Heterobilharzia americana]|nr:unnamed protein product [Heterobilharzia americana]